MIIFLVILIATNSSLWNVSSKEVVQPNEVTIVIVGPTGSGKSSLANVLLGSSPLCSNCTFPVCPGLHSCTKQTSMSRGPWLGHPGAQLVKIVDTPGFGDSDGDDSLLLDEMMTVLKVNVGEANVILLLMKEGETRLGRELQQMVREMKAMFGDGMWTNLVVGVSFWSFQQELVKFRASMCEFSKDNCKDEEWFEREMEAILKEKFKFEVDLPFVFVDSWAKHPLNVQDKNQEENFVREAGKLLSLAMKATPFEFRTVNDVLLENHVIKKRNALLENTIKEDIRNLFEYVQENNNSLNLFAEHIVKAEMNAERLRNLTEDTIRNNAVGVTQIKEELKNHKVGEATLRNTLSKEIIDMNTKNLNKFENLAKELHFLKINLAAESTERRSMFSAKQNMSTRLAVAENEVKHVKERMEREISSLKQQHNTLETTSQRKTNNLEKEMIKMSGDMGKLPGKWPGGSYCILANGGCPPGFARYQGHLYAIKMYSHLPQWVGAATFGDSFIKCHGTNCKYTNYAELRLTTCCK